MSMTPRRWVEQCWADVDWFLFQVNAHDDLMSLIADCRLHGKKVGVVWHCSAEFAEV